MQILFNFIYNNGVVTVRNLYSDREDKLIWM